MGKPADAAEVLESNLGHVSPDKLLEGCQVPLLWSMVGVALPPGQTVVAAVTLTNRAATQVLQGRLAEAQTTYEVVLKLYPSFYIAFQGLVYTMLRRGNTFGALQLLQNYRAFAA